MIDIQIIREQPEVVREAIRQKGVGRIDVVDRIVELDARRREVLTELQEAQARSNTVSRDVGRLMREGKKDEAADLIAENSRLKERIKELEETARTGDEEQNRLMLEIPNIPHPSVPAGKTPADNQVVAEYGSKPSFAFAPRSHWDLADLHGLIDFDRGSKVAGAGFPFYVGKGARLQRALINFFLDLAGEAGYTEIQSPAVVNADSARGTGQLPDKEDLMYEVPRDGLYMIPTAEVPVTNFHRDEIFEPGALPLKYAAYTPCFRREAGSHGKDVRGLNRLHQFDKVELVRFVEPETSYDALEELREDAERPLKKLGLPYRVL
ncbi:MAG: serine--tRNA ligase, partial [Rhodothermales bacterium]